MPSQSRRPLHPALAVAFAAAVALLLGLVAPVTAANAATATTTTLTSNRTPTAVVTQPLTLTATVSPGDAAGTVEFFDSVGGSPVSLGSATVAAGVAAVALTPGTLAVGSHSLTATFTPTDAVAFDASTSAPLAQSVIAVPQLGSLSISPATGDPGTVVSLTTVSTGTPKGCQRFGSETLRTYATVSGPGAWAAGFNFASSSTSGVSSTADFTRNPDTFASVASSNGVSIETGKYDITLFCTQGLGYIVGSFTGSVWFTSATAFQNTDPNNSQVTVTLSSFGVSPAGSQEVAKPVTLTATTDPTNAVGSVVFKRTTSGLFSTIGTAPVSSGTATLTVSNLPQGLHSITAEFVPTDSAAFTGATSSPISYVITAASPPANTVLPTITGTRQVGKVLTCSRGTWTGATLYTYSWYRSTSSSYSSPVLIRTAASTATTNAYTLTASDASRYVFCRVTATNAGGSVFRDAKAGLVALGVFVKVASPTITNGTTATTFKVGQKLTARVGKWTPSTGNKYSFRWYRVSSTGSLTAITGATLSTYTLKSVDKGKRITVKITVTRAGYKAATAYSTKYRVL